MLTTNSQRPLHVVIVGASISGLTLAHCLSSTNIDFTILEERPSSFTDGAGLVLLPSGTRILDQLGLYQDVLDWGERMVSHSTWLEDGRLIRQVDTLDLDSVKRTGYPLIIIARPALLSILFTRLRDKNRVFFNKKVSRIATSPDGVIVYTTDGSCVFGDLVVGADGVHSTVRAQMWNYIQYADPTAGRHISEVPLTIAYTAVFGISRAHPGLHMGHVHRAYGHGWAMLVMVGPESEVFWFVSMPRPADKFIPRHSCSDKLFVSGIVEPFLEKHVSLDVKFGEVFNRTKSCVFVPLEESLQTRWSWGRFASIGDAVHKMTPNIAEGANCAIETAVSLANHLVSFVEGSDNSYSEQRLHPALKTWEESRWRRMKFFFTLSQITVRLEVTTNWVLKMVRMYLGAFHGVGISFITDITPSTAHVDYLPLPQRGETGQDSKGKGKGKEKERSWNPSMFSTPIAAPVSSGLHVVRTAGG
ncbi:FAD/NAD(P)-binding domain-containing protein [Aspergillus ellipticus CBS 707.79]|uniref:FAD/NAD(P)-binding domain-containing protein n=1 Tax=Aspergillus ellipticus CBS 707.79 TaxID=1448320 RepID=A0A319E8U1_9EURO|nr:FAD/NAD(P)-binding domain-containing protein [Aspergillus ellipticus CBS 707.79]